MNFSVFPDKKNAVPFYAKFGWLVTWLLIFILMLMIAHNCVNSIDYGSQTNSAEVESFYQQGLRDGAIDQGETPTGKDMGNPVLRKAYTRGYREGLDQRRMGASES